MQELLTEGQLAPPYRRPSEFMCGTKSSNVEGNDFIRLFRISLSRSMWRTDMKAGVAMLSRCLFPQARSAQLHHPI